MILLDPDLDPGPPSQAHAGKRTAGPEIPEKENELPPLRALARFLQQARTAAGLRGKVNVLLTTDAHVRRLNRQFRGQDKATDVLSFPVADLIQDPEKNEEIGDVAISVETAQRQSVAYGHSLETEIRILILHGLLHLSGLDHETDRGEMARREQTLRALLGLKQGLIERADFRNGRNAGPSTSFAAKRAANSAQDDKSRAARKPSRSAR